MGRWILGSRPRMTVKNNLKSTAYKKVKKHNPHIPFNPAY
jgi:hypothetical protein